MPMTRDDVDALNAFVKAGQIKEARALLQSLEGEKVRSALVRLNAKYPDKTPQTEGHTSNLGAIALFVVSIAVIAFVVFGLIIPVQQESAEQSRQIAIYYEMREACDAYYREIGNSVAGDQRCNTEIEQIMTAYPAVANQCYDDYADIETMMLYCLNENGIAFNK